MNKFQIIIIGIFAGMALIAVLIFGGVLPGFKNGAGNGKGPEISIWGVFSRQQINQLISDLNDENESLFKINYAQKDPLTYKDEIINALASGTGPDVWTITQDAVLKTKDKVSIIPFEIFAERDFKDSFIDSAELYIADQGIVGVPIALDPMVLYWNKDLFSSAGIAHAPRHWDEFLLNAQSLTRRDQAGNIIQSGAALGEFRNVKNAKDILSMLILQTGNKIIDSFSLNVVFGERGNVPLNPAENTVQFFNEFSNPKKSSYSWNRALPSSDNMFVNGSLAMYFGYVSEFNELKERNPHLNFDVAVVPQIRDGAIQATFGKLYSVVISKMSVNKQASLSAGFKISGSDFNGRFAEALSMAPVRRDLLAQGIKEPSFSVFYKSAIMARAWLEPDSDKVYEIFQNMVESTATGKARVSAAVTQAKKQIEKLLK